VTAALLLALSLAAGEACGVPKVAPGARPWRTGESLTYELEVLGMVKAGMMQLAVERPLSAGKVIPLRVRVKTTKTVGNLSPFAAVGISWVDAGTLRPERYREEVGDGGARQSADARLVPAGPEIVVETQSGKTAGRHSARREREVLDPLSILYQLRAVTLPPGDRFCFDLVGTARPWRVLASVAPGTERVETPVGKFETLRVDFEIRRADKPDAKPRAVHAWIATDARRLPVAMVGESDFGPVSAKLTSLR
jgi:hypothetical protein